MHGRLYIYVYMQKRGKKVNNDDAQSLNINGVNINNQQHITDFFSNYFLTTADNITNKNITNTTKNYNININNVTSMHFFFKLSQQSILT